MLLYNNVK